MKTKPFGVPLRRKAYNKAKKRDIFLEKDLLKEVGLAAFSKIYCLGWIARMKTEAKTNGR